MKESIKNKRERIKPEDITISIVNPEAIPQARINLAKVMVRILHDSGRTRWTLAGD